MKPATIPASLAVSLLLGAANCATSKPAPEELPPPPPPLEVTFTRTPLQVGDSFVKTRSMTLTGELTQRGRVAKSYDQTERKARVRLLEDTPSQTRRLWFEYDRAEDRRQGKAYPSPLADQSYLVGVDAEGELRIKRMDDRGVSEAERAELAARHARVLAPSKLTEFLAQKGTFVEDQPVTVGPPHALLNLGVLDTAEDATMQLVLERVDGEEGAEVAHLAIDLTVVGSMTLGGEESEATLTLKGSVAHEVATSRPVDLALDGAVTLTPTNPNAAGGQISVVIRERTTYSR